MGCDATVWLSQPLQTISIHAPTWGATFGAWCDVFFAYKFQSTHPRGVRRHCLAFSASTDYFNPRTHVGCDNLGCLDRLPAGISIHAPTWGATIWDALTDYQREFQSTHPRGVRHGDRARLGRSLDFNPRTHVGCDIRKKDITPRTKYFNPRTHVGCDKNVIKMIGHFAYFNPRTHVGCDTKCQPNGGKFVAFQSTHPRGVRLLEDWQGRYGFTFQSTHPRGVRPVWVSLGSPSVDFNPRTHVGCDYQNDWSLRMCEISIHAPTWGATILKNQ